MSERTFLNNAARYIGMLAIAALTHFAMMADLARADEADEIRLGKQLAERLCARCHAIGKEGQSRLPIAPAFRTLSTKYPIDSLQEALAEGIVTGHTRMPQFEFAPDQVTALVAYIRSVQE